MGCSSRSKCTHRAHRLRFLTTARNRRGTMLTMLPIGGWERGLTQFHHGRLAKPEGTESTVRIVVATDSIGALSSRQAGEVIASGWSRRAEVSVLPIGEAGGGFAAAYAELAGFTTSSRVANGVIVTTGHGPDTASCRSSGRTAVLGFRASSRPERSATPSRIFSAQKPSPDHGRSGWSVGP